MTTQGSSNQSSGSGECSTSIASVFIHPQALCESSCIGDDTRIWAFAHVMEGARVGTHCNICDHVFVESGVSIGDRVTVKNGAMIWEGVTIDNDVFVGPGVLFTNDRFPRSRRMPEIVLLERQGKMEFTPTRVHRGASVGAGSVIVAGVTIGPFSMVGAGSVVTKSVAAHRLVHGNPARSVGWVCVCGRPVAGNESCGECGRRWRVECDSLIAVE